MSELTGLDQRLKTKILVARLFCIILALVLTALILYASGQDVAFVGEERGSLATGAKTVTAHEVSSSENPFQFFFYHFVVWSIGLAFVAAIYVLITRAIRWLHEKQLFRIRRKYPY